MRRTEGVVVIRGSEAAVFAPFEAKDAIKALPGRRWDKTAKCWWVPAFLADRAAEAIRPYCVRVTVDDGKAPEARIGPRPAGVDAFAAVLEHVGPMRRKVYRSLAAVLHPDHGGNEQLAKELNAAQDALGAA